MPTIAQEMSALDKRNFAWYGNLTEKEQKDLSMWVVMRWSACTVSNDHEANEYYLRMINDQVNVNFNELRHYPDMQFRLMQLAGMGTTKKHSWIAPMARKKKGLAANNKLVAFYETLHPYMNDEELGMVIGMYTKAEIKAELESHGLTAKLIKEMVK
jgi:hypothetical protein